MNTRKPAPTLAEVLAFLLGEAPLDGLNFGDNLPDRPRYWWRHILREAARPFFPRTASELNDFAREGLRHQTAERILQDVERVAARGNQALISIVGDELIVEEVAPRPPAAETPRDPLAWDLPGPAPSWWPDGKGGPVQ
jgi:hypothetical protein